MNDQCHDCKIRKLCYLEEPEEDWTCDHYEPCEYDEEVATDINVGNKDTISRKAAIEALEKDMASLDHIIKGMSANDVRLDAYVAQRNQVNYDIYTINNLPPAQLGTDLAEVGTDCISRKAAIGGKICIQRSNGVEIYDDYAVPVKYLEQLPPAQPAPSQVAADIARIVENGKDMRVIGQPERIKGRWIYHPEIGWGETWLCDQCGEKTSSTVMGKPRANFCPNCGADMREVADGNNN